MAQIPTPDLAVPYAAPKHVKTMADVQPIAPKNGCIGISLLLGGETMEWSCLRSCFEAGAEAWGYDWEYELHRPGWRKQS
jgi:hypothetical protein